MNSSLVFGADFLPINLIELVGVSMSMLFLLILASGFVIRFSAKPLVEALSKLGVGNLLDPARSLQEGTEGGSQLARLANRVTELEQEVGRLKGLVPRGAPMLAITQVTGEQLDGVERPEVRASAQPVLR